MQSWGGGDNVWAWLIGVGVGAMYVCGRGMCMCVWGERGLMGEGSKIR